MGLAQLHREILGCTRCVEAGYLQQAAPVLSGYPDNRIMLIGQAPGAVEAVRRLPFQGRSRKVLMGWLMRGGFSSEAQIRRQVYMTSITKCFPGKGTGGGDRRPSRAEVDLCRSHLDRQLALVKPELLILVGGLAHDRFLPGRQLDTRRFPHAHKVVAFPPNQRDLIGRCSDPSVACGAGHRFDAFETIVERREIPAATARAHDPEPASPFVEGNPPADTESGRATITVKCRITKGTTAEHPRK